MISLLLKAVLVMKYLGFKKNLFEEKASKYIPEVKIEFKRPIYSLWSLQSLYSVVILPLFIYDYQVLFYFREKQLP